MSAPAVRPQVVPIPTEHAITLGAGRDRPAGKVHRPVEWASGDGGTPTSPAAALAELLEAIPAKPEAWWSAHTWEGDRRDGSKWVAAAALVVDVDYNGAPELDEKRGHYKSTHAAPPDEVRAQLEQAALARKLPGNLFHLTPRGFRLVYLPAAPVTDRELYGRALEGACVEVRQALEALGLHARQDDEHRCARDGYAVDEGATDLARFLFAPRAIVNGEQRSADVRVLSEEPCDLTKLAEAAPPLAPTRAPATKRNGTRATAGRSSTDLAEAVARWNADHAQDWGRPGGGDCPACGHHGCFGRLPAIPEKWCCFSSNHAADSRGVGRESAQGRWFGDALDLEAHVSGRKRADVLRADGYLTDAKPRNRETTKPTAGAGAVAAEAGAVRDRQTIMLRDELGPVTDEAEAALLADPDAGIFVRARQLVRIVRDTGERRRGLVRAPDSPVIQSLPLDALRERIDRAADWVRFDARAKTERPVLPPEWVARTLASRPAWRFPYLAGVIEAPTMRPDGELLTAHGYDAGSGLMLYPAGDFPAILERPTQPDAIAAAARLLEPFADFPFLAATDRAAVLAAVLSIVARPAIDGCVPLFAVRAPAPGTGKSLLADVVCLIGTGRPAARMPLPREDGELQKVILTVAMEGSPAVLLDNVDGALGSHSLASAITASDWEGRLLGQSLKVTAPLRAVWIATGNGLTFRGDLGRRVTTIDLDAQLEHPEDRGDFTHPDLLGWTRQHRPQLVADALTLLRAYHVAGRPKHGKARKGSFEAWDDLVRGACVWVGLGDPEAGTERIRAEDDSDLAALGAVLEAWREAFGIAPKTAAEAVTVATEGTPLRDALLSITGREKLDTRTLGYALRRVRGRIVGGLRLTQAGESRASGARWVVAGKD